MADVPNVPGVPALPGYSGNNVALLVADAVSLIGQFLGPQWGIFLNGAKAFPYRSVVDFGYKQDWPTSDYNVEDGGFQSYDKVELPFDVKVRITSGGDATSRQALITQLVAAGGGLDLYDVVTPEYTFPSCSIVHLSIDRSADSGVGMIIADVWFEEIRVTATSTFSNTQSPAVAGQQSTGNVSPQAPSQAVQQGFDSGGLTVQ